MRVAFQRVHKADDLLLVAVVIDGDDAVGLGEYFVYWGDVIC